MKKKKIALIATSPATICAFLIPQIKALSCKYDVFIVTNLCDKRKNLDQISDRVTFIHLPILRPIRLVNDLVSLFKLARILKKHQFTLVHSFTPKAGLLSSISAKLTRIRFRFHTFTGQVWATEKGFKRALLKSCDKITARLNTHILVDSASQRDYLVENHLLKTIRCAKLLLNGSISGVDTKRFKPMPEIRSSIRQYHNISESTVLFLFVGRIRKSKGILELAHAFKQLSSNHELKQPIALMLVGDDEDNLMPEVTKILCGIKQNVHYVSHTTEPENYMASSDILCLPSYREGFGSVVIEAAACQVPAIASRIYGLTDAIVDQQTGLLFPVNDTDALSSIMFKLVQDKDLRYRLGEQAYLNANTRFSQNMMIDAWMDYYHKTLNQYD